MLADGRTVPHDEVVHTDICIVGAGPAGITLARELGKQGLDVLLVERGPDLREAPATTSDTAVSVGIPYRVARSRMFGVGGSTYRWDLSTPVGDGLGRLRELDDSDFELRSWVPNSGWPLNKADLRPFYDRARALFYSSFPSEASDEAWDAEVEQSPFSKPADTVKTRIFYFGNPGVFAGELRRELENSPSVLLLSNSAATEIVCEGSPNSVSSLKVMTSPTHSYTVEARAYVLAAGGIENPRLLLTSRGRHREGVGNGYDLVGRFFMEHPHYRSGYLVPSDSTIFQNDSSHKVYLHDGIPIQKKYGLTDEVIEREQLTRCVFYLTQAPVDERVNAVRYGESATRAVEAVNRLYHGLVARRWVFGVTRDVGIALKGPHHIIRHGANRVISRAGQRLGLTRYTTPQLFWIFAMAEQIPNSDSRVSLGTVRDRFGVPIAELDWRLSEQDVASMKRSQDLFGAAQLRAGHRLVRSNLEDKSIPPHVVGGNHHMGTTRMADAPRSGVVDRDCRVHDVNNLFVCGSSVFPTSGYANPTLTLLALTIRLADHLSRNIRRN